MHCLSISEMTSLTQSLCWDLVTIKKDKLNSVAAAIYRKPVSNDCYKNRKHNSPPMCKDDDDPNAAWWVYFFPFPLSHSTVALGHWHDQIRAIFSGMFLYNHACTGYQLLVLYGAHNGLKIGPFGYRYLHIG